MSSSSIVLAINAGSSSLKFACYDCSTENIEKLLCQGSITRIGSNGGNFSVADESGKSIHNINSNFPTIHTAAERMFQWITAQPLHLRPVIIGHRVVHGGRDYSRPELISEEVISTLENLSAIAPEHIPPVLKMIKYALKEYSTVPHIACFDTAFHRTMPEVAQMYAVPAIFRKDGLQKYGFHGLSYQYIMNVLHKEDDLNARTKRILIAHLGHGASMAAVKNGNCVDTTMGFSPCGGFPMSTRLGDCDPEVILYLIQHGGVPLAVMKDMLNKESGVLAISEKTGDFRDLLHEEESDIKCKLAIDYFCYHLRKHIGAMVSAMTGIDTLVFTAGIGENSSMMRKRICNGLEYLGIELDEGNNERNETVISSASSRVIVRVINTNEEVVIAKLCRGYIHDR
jgi:acetate kinase